MNIIKNKLLILLILLILIVIFILLNIYSKNENFTNYKITDFHNKKYNMKLPKSYYNKNNLDETYKKYFKLNKEYEKLKEYDTINNYKPYNIYNNTNSYNNSNNSNNSNNNKKFRGYNSVFNELDDYRIKIKNYTIYNKPLGFKCQRNYNDCTQLYLLK